MSPADKPAILNRFPQFASFRTSRTGPGTMNIEQAIETAMRWQEEFTWRQAAKAVSDFKHLREMAQKDEAVVWQTERRIAELQSRLAGELSADTRRDLEAELSQETAFRAGDVFECFVKHAQLHDRISEMKHAEAVAMQRELLALEWFVREHCPQLLGDVPAVHVFGTLPDMAAGIAAMRRLEGALRGLNAVKTPPGQPGQPGHLKKSIGPPEDVQEVNRMMALKRWQGKKPIEVCRAYVRQRHKNATDEFVETQAQSLKRKRNRY